MKKSILKAFVFLAVFVLSLWAAGKIMNKGHDNLTVDMQAAVFPTVSMEKYGVSYNRLYGYAGPMDVAFQKDNLTILGEKRNTYFTIDTYNQDITGIEIEVRNIDGSRLIENTRITEYDESTGQIKGEILLKDLIEPNTEYSLAVILTLNQNTKVYYYTRVIWSETLNDHEKLDYVLDFHNRTFDKEAAEDIRKYLETNSKLENNKSFYKVNIHSSFAQITWGDLNVKEIGKLNVSLKEMDTSTASYLLDYVVSTTDDSDRSVYYTVEEYFRVRYSKDRMYLLDYERTMTQIADASDLCANDKILLGITDEDVPMAESEDGNTVAFVANGRLFSYQADSNKIAYIYGYFNSENADYRTLHMEHDIKILDVMEGGNVIFAVYGYANRGRHEGHVGVYVYQFNSSLNTIEELVNIDSDKPYSVIKNELEELLCISRDNLLYLKINNTVYRINLADKSYDSLVSLTRDGEFYISENHKIVMWTDGETAYDGTAIRIRNLSTNEENRIQARTGEILLPLAFMEEDLIFGVAREEDLNTEDYAVEQIPMYKICIASSSGQILKEYSQENIYITGCSVEDNQITLDRVLRQENGTYKATYQDHIMNNTEQVSGKNVVAAADIDVYKRYVQIKVRKEIEKKTLKYVTPKEVVFEGGRVLNLEGTGTKQTYFVYGAYGVEGSFVSPAKAVNLATEIAGTVMDEQGYYIWKKTGRSTKNQIMAIKEVTITDDEKPLAACIDLMLKYKEVVKNTALLLEQGQTPLQILTESLDHSRVLDMTDSTLDAMLYYVDRDIPVLVLLGENEGTLITGFNSSQLVLFNPKTGSLYKKSINEAKELFAEYGNRFITYMDETQD